MKALEPRQPPEELLILFGDVLESMTNLQVLDWKIPKDLTHLFGDSFVGRKLILSSTKELILGPHSHYLVSMCPELEILQSGGGLAWYNGYLPNDIDWNLMLIQAAGSAPKLRRFEMVGGHNGWSTELAAEAVKSMPQITSLGIKGSLGDELHYGPSFDQDYNKLAEKGILKQILDVVTGFQNLTHLDLPYSSSLGLGFDGGPGCGNAYFGKRGREYRRRVIKQGAEATERGATVVLTTLPYLESFTIGNTKAIINRGENGMLNATWPWTGRMREWQMEAVPEKPDLEV